MLMEILTNVIRFMINVLICIIPIINIISIIPIKQVRRNKLRGNLSAGSHQEFKNLLTINIDYINNQENYRCVILANIMPKRIS